MRCLRAKKRTSLYGMMVWCILTRSFHSNTHSSGRGTIGWCHDSWPLRGRSTEHPVHMHRCFAEEAEVLEASEVKVVRSCVVVWSTASRAAPQQRTNEVDGPTRVWLRPTGRDMLMHNAPATPVSYRLLQHRIGCFRVTSGAPVYHEHARALRVNRSACRRVDASSTIYCPYARYQVFSSSFVVSAYTRVASSMVGIVSVARWLRRTVIVVVDIACLRERDRGEVKI